MDGSAIQLLAQHPAAVGFAIIIAVGVGYALYAHTKSCKESRKDLHTAVNGLTERVAGLEAESRTENGLLKQLVEKLT